MWYLAAIKMRLLLRARVSNGELAGSGETI